MSFEYIILIVGYIFGFYMSWNIGANDVANSMGTSVASKAITIRQAVFLAGILNIVGAVFIGTHVTNTISKGIVSPEVLADPVLPLLGALSALLAGALWVSFATWKSLPVSTTHSIVGAMIGFGIMAGGVGSVQWGKVIAVVISWVVSPLFSLFISFVLFKIIIKVVLSKKKSYVQALKAAPFFIGIVIFVIVLSFLFKTPLGKTMEINTWTALLAALFISFVFGITGKLLLRFFTSNKNDEGTEEIFKKIQIGTACYVSLAHGANDVANAIGPLAVIHFMVFSGILLNQSDAVSSTVHVPVFLLLFGGIGIACGIAMAGQRVMRTIGEKITAISNSRGYAVEFAAATTVLIASKMGLPVSTTHAAIGGVIGVGLARGIEVINFQIVFKIMLYWILTVPVSAITSMVIFKILRLVI